MTPTTNMQPPLHSAWALQATSEHSHLQRVSLHSDYKIKSPLQSQLWHTVVHFIPRYFGYARKASQHSPLPTMSSRQLTQGWPGRWAKMFWSERHCDWLAHLACSLLIGQDKRLMNYAPRIDLRAFLYQRFTLYISCYRQNTFIRW